MEGLGRMADTGKRVSRNFNRSISRNLSVSSWGLEDMFRMSLRSRGSQHVIEDEEALRWTALEKLPTYVRLRTIIMKSIAENEDEGTRLIYKEVDIRQLEINECCALIDRIFRVAEEDNEKFLRKLRDRIDRYPLFCMKNELTSE